MSQDVFEMQSKGMGAKHGYVRDSDELISTAVTLAVTDVLERDVDSLEPLGEVLDVDALDELAASTGGNVTIEFEYEDCLVTIRRGSEIFVTPIGSDSDYLESAGRRGDTRTASGRSQ